MSNRYSWVLLVTQTHYSYDLPSGLLITRELLLSLLMSHSTGTQTSGNEPRTSDLTTKQEIRAKIKEEHLFNSQMMGRYRRYPRSRVPGRGLLNSFFFLIVRARTNTHTFSFRVSCQRFNKNAVSTKNLSEITKNTVQYDVWCSFQNEERKLALKAKSSEKEDLFS
jgi:hypothetical protein